jgi:hypothetical protein
VAASSPAGASTCTTKPHKTKTQNPAFQPTCCQCICQAHHCSWQRVGCKLACGCQHLYSKRQEQYKPQPSGFNTHPPAASASAKLITAPGRGSAASSPAGASTCTAKDNNNTNHSHQASTPTHLLPVPRPSSSLQLHRAVGWLQARQLVPARAQQRPKTLKHKTQPFDPPAASASAKLITATAPGGDVAASSPAGASTCTTKPHKTKTQNPAFRPTCCQCISQAHHCNCTGQWVGCQLGCWCQHVHANLLQTPQCAPALSI